MSKSKLRSFFKFFISFLELIGFGILVFVVFLATAELKIQLSDAGEQVQPTSFLHAANLGLLILVKIIVTAC